MQCKLCESKDVNFFFSDKNRKYIHCSTCNLIFVPDEDYVSVDLEIERYNLHDNTIGNQGYVSYLNEVALIVYGLAEKNMSILDFGCGKNAVLSGILQKAGFVCDSYDPLFSRAFALPVCKYDIVILCEVIEHLRGLKQEMRLVNDTLKHCGNLIVRTQLYENLEKFKVWWYKQDYTHINFFSRTTLDYLAISCKRRVKETRYRDIFILSTEE